MAWDSSFNLRAGRADLGSEMTILRLEMASMRIGRVNLRLESVY